VGLEATVSSNRNAEMMENLPGITTVARPNDSRGPNPLCRPIAPSRPIDEVSTIRLQREGKPFRSAGRPDRSARVHRCRRRLAPRWPVADRAPVVRTRYPARPQESDCPCGSPSPGRFSLQPPSQGAMQIGASRAVPRTWRSLSARRFDASFLWSHWRNKSISVILAAAERAKLS